MTMISTAEKLSPDYVDPSLFNKETAGLMHAQHSSMFAPPMGQRSGSKMLALGDWMIGLTIIIWFAAVTFPNLQLSQPPIPSTDGQVADAGIDVLRFVPLTIAACLIADIILFRRVLQRVDRIFSQIDANAMLLLCFFGI